MVRDIIMQRYIARHCSGLVIATNTRQVAYLLHFVRTLLSTPAHRHSSDTLRILRDAQLLSLSVPASFFLLLSLLFPIHHIFCLPCFPPTPPSFRHSCKAPVCSLMNTLRLAQTAFAHVKSNHSLDPLARSS